MPRRLRKTIGPVALAVYRQTPRLVTGAEMSCARLSSSYGMSSLGISQPSTRTLARNRMPQPDSSSRASGQATFIVSDHRPPANVRSGAAPGTAHARGPGRGAQAGAATMVNASAPPITAIIQPVAQTRITFHSGVIAEDAATQEKASGHYLPGGWTGRYTWRNRFPRGTFSAIHNELISQKSSWPPLKDGLFGGSAERANEAFNGMEEAVHRARQLL